MEVLPLTFNLDALIEKKDCELLWSIRLLRCCLVIFVIGYVLNSWKSGFEGYFYGFFFFFLVRRLPLG